MVNVPGVRDYAQTLPNVAYVADNLFTCSQDTQKLIREAIAEHRINRVVVAACTPRTHEPLFQETIREAGLNRYLFELANIRDQDSWVHQAEPEKATEKAKDLVRMAVAKVTLLEPIERCGWMTQSALVVGGGIAGMNAALSLADQGFKTYLIEEKAELGGHGLKVKHTWSGDERSVRRKSHPERQASAILRCLPGPRSNRCRVLWASSRPRSSNGMDRDLEHGVAILATGAHSLKPICTSTVRTSG